MTNHDGQIGRWLDLGPDGGPTAALDDVFARVVTVRQRPAWLVALRGGTVDGRPVDRRIQLAAIAGVAILAFVAGGLYAGGVIDRSPDPSTLLPTPTPQASPPTTATPEVIVFTETRELATGEEDCTFRFGCHRSWVAIVNVDGGGQRRLFPDGPPNQSVVAVARDGSRMIVTGVRDEGDPARNPSYYLTDLRGSEPERLDTRCDLPCFSDWIGNVAFSPDGRRIAFVRSVTEVPGALDGTSSVIAVMDLGTGEVIELESTFASNPDLGMPCGLACGEGSDDAPRWSPDGTRLLFTRSAIGVPNKPRKILDTALYVVDADGANLRQLVPLELFGRDAQWSPDGSRILFTSAIETLTLDDFGLLENWHQLNDIYTVRPDGSDIRRLTSFTDGPVPDRPGDLGPEQATWTGDGRIIFNRRAATPGNPEEVHWEPWIMDADGGNATLLTSTDAASLTALGCVECAYPEPSDLDYPAFGFWRPIP